jgi:hypothetical protein
MKKTQDIPKATMPSTSSKLIIAQGIIENLPEIIGAIKEIYVVHKNENMFSQGLQGRLSELNINRDNFKVLVQSLTDLSKTDNADKETKQLYRDMIKALFEIFASNMRSTQNISDFLNRL